MHCFGAVVGMADRDRFTFRVFEKRSLIRAIPFVIGTDRKGILKHADGVLFAPAIQRSRRRDGSRILPTLVN